VKIVRLAFNRPILAGSLVLALCLLSSRAAQESDDWSDSIPSCGGSFFSKTVNLPVAAFAQGDPRWSGQCLGSTSDTLEDEGCTLTSVVMVLNYYGIKTDPGHLNRFLSSHFGYDKDGLLSFEQVTTYAPERIRLVYQGICTYASLDRNLLAGHPVIIQVTLPDGGMHFVVVAGKQGYDYLVKDPAAYPDAGLIPLQQITSRIDREYIYLKKS
jgi:hypothetical protein